MNLVVDDGSVAQRGADARVPARSQGVNQVLNTVFRGEMDYRAVEHIDLWKASDKVSVGCTSRFLSTRQFAL